MYTSEWELISVIFLLHESIEDSDFPLITQINFTTIYENNWLDVHNKTFISLTFEPII